MEQEEGLARIFGTVERWLQGVEAKEMARAQVADSDETKIKEEWDRLTETRAAMSRREQSLLDPSLIDSVIESRNALERQVASQAETIAMLRGELERAKEGFDRAAQERTLLRREDVREEAPDPRRQRAMRTLDDTLYQDGPVPLIEEVNEETLAWLLDLAARNAPIAGAEVNEREVAQIIKAVTPLVFEIERLQDILVSALVIYPCHMHEGLEICDEKLALMGLLLIQEVGLPPNQMYHARHKGGTCDVCDGAALMEPGPPPDYRDGNDISDEDLDELPW